MDDCKFELNAEQKKLCHEITIGIIDNWDRIQRMYH